jgi:hypothetical protein
MYEYANVGLQGWRYRGVPDCIFISGSGRRAVVVGPVTHSQGPDAPALGTRVAFVIDDRGDGGGEDGAIAALAGNLSCPIFLLLSGEMTAGNYSIQRR